MAGLLTATETASILATVTSALDQSLPLYTRSVGKDSSGHNTESYPGSPSGTLACNVLTPSATVLQTYAGIIGSKRALVLRVLTTATASAGDRVVYDSVNWRLQALIEQSSYRFTKRYLITTVV